MKGFVYTWQHTRKLGIECGVQGVVCNQQC